MPYWVYGEARGAKQYGYATRAEFEAWADRAPLRWGGLTIPGWNGEPGPMPRASFND